MLEVGDLTIAYGVNRVIRGVSLRVEQGSVFTLLGPNGAGKTSILKAISGLMRIVSGEIKFLGKSLLGLEPDAIVRLGISQVPEGRRMFPEMSVLDNLLLGATVHSHDKRRVKELLERNFELFPILKERAKQTCGTLSGGEQQQAAIARGLMADPRFLLVDEPSLGLAPVLISSVAKTFKQMSEMGLTILVAEQNADFGLKVASSGGVLSGGEMIFQGSIDSLRNTDEVRRAYLGA